MKILIVEDEREIVRFLELELQHEGYETEARFDGQSGLEAALGDDIDLILLDVMLPDRSGMEILRRLRREKDTPVIFVTARDSVMDKVAGLDMGAADYITKPFHMEELLARVRAAVRRTHAQANGPLTAGDIVLDPLQRTVTRGGAPVTLTKTQYDLLEYLMRNKNIVLTRDQLLSAVWGYQYAGDSNIVDVYIRYVRNRLHETEDNRLIETVRGVGYVLRDKQGEG